jgi:hypothetical protein
MELPQDITGSSWLEKYENKKPLNYWHCIDSDKETLGYKKRALVIFQVTNHGC